LHPERLLAAVRESREATPPAPVAERFAPPTKSHWSPNAEMFINTEDRLVINVELAGIRRENLEITIDGHRLIVNGQRPAVDEPANFRVCGKTLPRPNPVSEARDHLGAPAETV